MIPFKAVYGRDPSTLTRYNVDDSDPPSIKELLQHMDSPFSKL